MHIVKILHEPYSTALETTHGNRKMQKNEKNPFLRFFCMNKYLFYPTRNLTNGNNKNSNLYKNTSIVNTGEFPSYF